MFIIIYKYLPCIVYLFFLWYDSYYNRIFFQLINKVLIFVTMFLFNLVEVCTYSQLLKTFNKKFHFMFIIQKKVWLVRIKLHIQRQYLFHSSLKTTYVEYIQGLKYIFLFWFHCRYTSGKWAFSATYFLKFISQWHTCKPFLTKFLKKTTLSR